MSRVPLTTPMSMGDQARCWWELISSCIAPGMSVQVLPDTLHIYSAGKEAVLGHEDT